MNQDKSINFSSQAEFLAHAQALEQELANNYAQMADSFDVHNNPAVARLFHQLADHEETNAGKLIRLAQGMELPKIPPWQYLWLAQDGPENCMQETNYLMTPSQALQLAIRIENCAITFYTQTTQGTSDPNVIDLARDMLSCKLKHLTLLQDWLRKASENHPEAKMDLDPPHMPE